MPFLFLYSWSCKSPILTSSIESLSRRSLSTCFQWSKFWNLFSMTLLFLKISPSFSSKITILAVSSETRRAYWRSIISVSPIYCMLTWPINWSYHSLFYFCMCVMLASVYLIMIWVLTAVSRSCSLYKFNYVERFSSLRCVLSIRSISIFWFFSDCLIFS